MNNYRLILDDFRTASMCGEYMPIEIARQYYKYDWVIVRSYPEFVAYITEHGLPSHVSFDHDLVAGHYHKNMQNGILNYEGESFKDDANKTGYHCAQWLINYIKERNLELPEIFVHSQNPVGAKNIFRLFMQYRTGLIHNKWQN